MRPVRPGVPAESATEAVTRRQVRSGQGSGRPAIAAIGRAPPTDRVALIHRLRVLHERRVQALEARLEEDEFDDVYDRMTAEYAVGFNRWAAGWAGEAEEHMRAASSPEPPAPSPGPVAPRRYFIDR